MKTFRFSASDSEEFKIHFRIKKESNYQRFIELIGISGNYSSCVDIIIQFIRCLIKNAKKVKIVKKKNIDILQIQKEIKEGDTNLETLTDSQNTKICVSHK